MRITVLYDNNAKDGLKAGWGFSCLIENGKNVLFDCGDNGKALIYNIKKLDINPKAIDIIVLSHEHWDHTGGMPDLLELTGKVTVVVPRSFSEGIKDRIRERANLTEIGKQQEISTNVYTTGELDSSIGLKEQALAVKTPEGLLVITGCAHPGLTAIVGKAKELGKIYGVMGGFHGFSDFEVLKDIRMLAPCHCTQHAREIRELYPKSYREIKAGSVIEL